MTFSGLSSSVIATADGTDWATILSTLVVGLLAATAAIAGVLITQRAERAKAKHDRELQQRTTIATLRASIYDDESSGLRSALAEYLTLTYNVEMNFKMAMSNKLPWPGDHMDLVNREDQLYNSLQLLLDAERPSHAALIQDLGELRNARSDRYWTDRRDAVLVSAREVLRDQSSQIMSALDDDVAG